MAHLLAHRAHVGIVEWDGVTYEGNHEPLVDRATFDRVQELLAARAVRGTRERRHHHYLKGLLVCGACGRRLSIQHSNGTYYANAIDVTMLRREQERIGAELRTIEWRQGVLDASLDDWQEVMDLDLRFSTRCSTAYRRAGDRTRRLLNAAMLDEVHVRAGHVDEATYKELFDLLFSSPKFEYGDVVGRGGFEPP